MRAFVRLKELAASHGDLAQRLAELEDKTEALAQNHDTFNRNTRNQLKQVFDALRELMTPPEPPKRPIGFVTHEDKEGHGLTRAASISRQQRAGPRPHRSQPRPLAARRVWARLFVCRRRPPDSASQRSVGVDDPNLPG